MSVRRASRGLTDMSDEMVEFLKNTESITPRTDIPTISSEDFIWEMPFSVMKGSYSAEEWETLINALGGIVKPVTRLSDLERAPRNAQAFTGVLKGTDTIVVWIDEDTPWIALHHELIHVRQHRRILDEGFRLSELPQDLENFAINFMELETVRWEMLTGSESVFDTSFMVNTRQNFVDIRNSLLGNTDFGFAYSNNPTFKSIINIIGETYHDDPLLSSVLQRIRDL